MKKLGIALICGVLAFAACKEDTPENNENNNNNTEDTTDNTPNYSERHNTLTAGKWVLVGGKIDPPIQIPVFDTVITVSDFSQIDQREDCEKDDAFVFNDDGSAETNYGASKCDGQTGDSEPNGTWMFLNNEEKIFLAGTEDTLLLNIVTLNSTDLNVETFYYLDEQKSDSARVLLDFENK